MGVDERRYATRHVKRQDTRANYAVVKLRIFAGPRALARVQGDAEAFVKAALAEYSELSQVHLGPEMLMSIGIQYEVRDGWEWMAVGWVRR